jgi:hypothetical protein
MAVGSRRDQPDRATIKKGRGKRLTFFKKIQLGSSQKMSPPPPPPPSSVVLLDFFSRVFLAFHNMTLAFFFRSRQKKYLLTYVAFFLSSSFHGAPCPEANRIIDQSRVCICSYAAMQLLSAQLALS